ncbi:hypothetical protein FRC09_009653 [Ceratobasidium sp. 395]|nr:hypothetical protein FRC09_009653 [Ceratobasidium sp. 395]
MSAALRSEASVGRMLFQAVSQTPGVEQKLPSISRYLASLSPLQPVELCLNNRIQVLESSISAVPDHHPLKPAFLNLLVDLLEKRSRRSNNIRDLNNAIQHLAHLTSNLLHDEHVLKPGCCQHLAKLYGTRFGLLHDPADLTKVIEYHTWANLFTPEGDPDKPHRLNNLAVSHGMRFQLLSKLEDIDQAIYFLSQAISLVRGKHPELYLWLQNLGSFHRHRFEFQGQSSDLDCGIQYLTEAPLAAPSDHKSSYTAANNLAAVYLTRFKSHGELPDLNKAFEYLREAESSTPKGLDDQVIRLHNLGMLYAAAFTSVGDLSDIKKAIEYLTEAVSRTPDDHPLKLVILDTCSVAYQYRFDRQGELADIDNAIEFSLQAALATPEGHLDKPMRFHNLGCSFRNRYKRLKDISDLDAAIDFQTQAASSAPAHYTQECDILHQLGVSHVVRFQRLGDLADLDTAIEYQDRALSITPQRHLNRPKIKNDLGSFFALRFSSRGDVADIETAIQHQSQVVLGGSSQHPDYPRWLNHLGSSYRRRFDRLGELADINHAIECYSQALPLVHDAHAEKPGCLFNLGLSYGQRFNVSEEQEDIKRSSDYLRQAAQLSTGHPSLKLKAALTWARVSSQHDLSSSLDAYKRAMALVPQVIWLGAAVGRRIDAIKSEIQDAAVEAAANAISLGAYEHALEWLEEGRSIIWNQMHQLRTPIEELARLDPSLALELNKTAQELDASGLAEPTHSLLFDTMSSQNSEQRRHNLAQTWETLVDRARGIPGFSGFLRPKNAKELLLAAHSSTLVVVNLHRTRCDALAVLPGSEEIIHIPLPSFSFDKATEASTHLFYCLRRANVRTRSERRPVFDDEGEEEIERELNGQFGSLLATLWEDLVEPVLERLGYLSTESQLPRLTWCTTGPLTFLPLHAAGRYYEPIARTFDFVVSSYTPTLSALLNPNQGDSEFRGVLAVGQADTLPWTVVELDQLQEQTKHLPFARLDGPDASPAAVLEEIQRNSWVHFACHASQDIANPMKSALRLHGGDLDLATITRESINHGKLAFLSACETARGDEGLPEESVHLAAGMILAGFPDVIATMW